MTEAPTQKKTRQGRWTLFALIAITIAPVLASYLAYYVWKPSGGKTYGELLAGAAGAGLASWPRWTASRPAWLI